MEVSSETSDTQCIHDTWLKVKLLPTSTLVSPVEMNSLVCFLCYISLFSSFLMSSSNSLCMAEDLQSYVFTAPQHLVCRVVQSLHTNHMQMSIVEVFVCRRLHMNTSMIPVCILLICRLCTALHTKCCGAVLRFISSS